MFALTREEIVSLLDQYRAQRAGAERIGGDLTRRIEELLASEGIQPNVPVHYRVKSLGSVIGKTARRDGAHTLSSVHDFVGVRVVVPFLHQLTSVSELILRNFTVDEYDDKWRQQPDNQFGYVSSHFVVRISEDVTSQNRPTRAEVQVRTMAQHIWATASHQLQYKREKDVPVELRRATNRLSALLELADAEFGRLFEEHARYEARINRGIPADAPLNVDTLRRTLEAVLPSANRAVQDDYAALLSDLFTRGIATAGQLRVLVEQQLENALAYDKEVATLESARLAKHGVQISTLDRPVQLRLQRDAFATYTGLIRIMLEYQFNEHYKDMKR